MCGRAVLLLLLLLLAQQGAVAAHRSSCRWGPEVRGAALPGFLVGHNPPYQATNLSAAKTWCCAMAPRCAGITFHGDGAWATQHYDAMGGKDGADRCQPTRGDYTNTSTWIMLSCSAPPAPAPAPPLPPPPVGWQPEWHIDPATVRIQADQRHLLASSSAQVDLAAQMGEYEEQQLWMVAPAGVNLHNITVQFPDMPGSRAF
eukprot:SAG31_NODE_7471_length_1681_cov_1.331858_2_plen_202_part_00